MTNKSIFENILLAEKAKYSTAKGWWQISCPNPSHTDNNPSCGIIYNESTDEIKVNCLVPGCSWQDAQKALEKQYNFSNIKASNNNKKKQDSDLPAPVKIDDTIINPDYVTSLLNSYGLNDIDFNDNNITIDTRYFPNFSGYNGEAKKICFAYPYYNVENPEVKYYKYKTIYRYVKNKEDKTIEIYMPNKLGIGKREQCTTKNIQGFFLPENIITNDNTPLWLVWGEEKALILKKAGQRVIGVLNGEGNIKQDEINYIKRHNNTKINIVADNDEAGYNAAIKITEKLLNEGFDVKGLLLPESTTKGYDINNYVVDNGLKRLCSVIDNQLIPAKLFITRLSVRLQEIYDKIKADKENERPVITQGKIMSFNELTTLDIPPTQWLVEGLIPEGKTLLAATPKIGKTTFALQLAKALVTGQDFLGLPTNKCDVMYMSYDMSQALTRDYVLNIFNNDGLNTGFYVFTETDFQFSKSNNEKLINTIKDNCPNIKLLIVDTLHHSLGTNNSGGNAYEKDVDSHKGLVDFCNKSGISVLMIHHLNKLKEKVDPFAAISGSSGIRSAYDTNLVMAKISDIQCDLHIEGRSAYTQDKLELLRTPKRIWELNGKINTDLITNLPEKQTKDSVVPDDEIQFKLNNLFPQSKGIDQ